MDDDDEVDPVDMLLDGFWSGVKYTGSAMNAVKEKTLDPLVEYSGQKEYIKETGNAMKSSTSEIYEKGFDAPVLQKSYESYNQAMGKTYEKTSEVMGSGFNQAD